MHLQMLSYPPLGCDSDAIKLFIGNIPTSYTEETLSPVFEKFGQIVEVVITRDRVTHNSKGSAFIWFAKRETALIAIQCLHKKCKLPDNRSHKASQLLVVREADPHSADVVNFKKHDDYKATITPHSVTHRMDTQEDMPWPRSLDVSLLGHQQPQLQQHIDLNQSPAPLSDREAKYFSPPLHIFSDVLQERSLKEGRIHLASGSGPSNLCDWNRQELLDQRDLPGDIHVHNEVLFQCAPSCMSPCQRNITMANDHSDTISGCQKMSMASLARTFSVSESSQDRASFHQDTSNTFNIGLAAPHLSFIINRAQVSVINDHMHTIQVMSGSQLYLKPYEVPGLFLVEASGTMEQMEAAGCLFKMLGLPDIIHEVW